MIEPVGLQGVGAVEDIVLVAQFVGDVLKGLAQVLALNGKNAWPPVSAAK